MQAFGLDKQNKIFIKLASDKKSASELEVIPTGSWETPYHGDFNIDDIDLQEMVSHFNDNIRAHNKTEGLPIDYEHDDDGGAAGWITNLRVAPSSANPLKNSLWADVKWTPQASEQIKGGVYKFFSPEFWPEGYTDPETGAEMNNVLVGGGLTNRPLFKGLAPVAAKDSVQDSKKVLTANSPQSTLYLGNRTMKLTDILKKAATDLTSEEQKFLVEHSQELSASDRTKYGIKADENPEDEDKKEESTDDSSEDEAADDSADESQDEGAVEGREVKISASELRALKAQASQGAEALVKLNRKEASEKVQAWLFNDKTGGHFPTTLATPLTDFYQSLDSKQSKAFSEIVKKMPNAQKLFTEYGGDEGVQGGATEAIQKLASEIMEKNNKLDYKAALNIIASDHKDMYTAYIEEIEN